MSAAGACQNLMWMPMMSLRFCCSETAGSTSLLSISRMLKLGSIYVGCKMAFSALPVLGLSGVPANGDAGLACGGIPVEELSLIHI